eukprot:TRINITY_DN2576_c0_g1_i1.p1 TRINITY_DN2576_c0_g1~~TRINITY_DN2576_c0_g1_i1.p1  ORF type:complete len:957 (+),score=225.13 TRINITY_DN2576_c0_g1_i1:38-2908(+)
MGVPSFFRWLVRKYPRILENAKEVMPDLSTGAYVDATLPNPNGIEFDCLYLDMNGIIHPCTHPQDRVAPETEDEMMRLIFETVDRLFNIARPRRLLYMAIDGVAPRAKLNQQRSRRFRSAKEAKETAIIEMTVTADLIAKGVIDEAEAHQATKKRWDSNQITPGTPFMEKVTESLVFYIMDRLSTNPAWKDITVVLSDGNVPGEGEHKLMEYIRYQRSQEGYPPNTRHCISGLDADLIMLGLASHEPYFSILREDVSNQKANVKLERDANLVEVYMHQPYQFLHLNILREYLDIDLRVDLPFKYDLERAIDDYVFLCFFVGNDFLPHLPTLEIREGAIDLLVDVYKAVLPSLGGYITENGTVNFERVDVLINEIAQLENFIIRERIMKEDNINRKREKREALKSNIEKIKVKAEMNNEEREEANQEAANELRQVLGCRSLKKEETQQDKIKKNIKEAIDKTAVDPVDEIRFGEEGWRDRYYKEKFGVSLQYDTEFFEKMNQDFAEGLQWVLYYYYQGCKSWSWYYPYHYAPFTSEVAKLSSADVKFPPNTKPFTPVEQLMSVLPEASSQFIPPECRELMRDEDSPIIDLYPQDFEIDMNGKKFAWQGVALLPFIDEKRMLEAVKPIEEEFTEEQKYRNRVGSNLIFVNKHNPIAKFIKEAETTEGKIKLENTTTFGFVSQCIEMERINLESHVPSNIEGIPDLECNFACCARYDLPETPPGFVFKSKLLKDVILPTPLLSKSESAKRRNDKRIHKALYNKNGNRRHSSGRGRGGRRNQRDGFERNNYNRRDDNAGYSDDYKRNQQRRDNSRDGDRERRDTDRRNHHDNRGNRDHYDNRGNRDHHRDRRGYSQDHERGHQEGHHNSGYNGGHHNSGYNTPPPQFMPPPPQFMPPPQGFPPPTAYNPYQFNNPPPQQPGYQPPQQGYVGNQQGYSFNQNPPIQNTLTQLQDLIKKSQS